jgi:hypothetical protein
MHRKIAMLRKLVAIILLFLGISCQVQKISVPKNNSGLTGTDFYKQAASYNWKQRDSLAVKEILAGNMPGFLKKFTEIRISFIDSADMQTVWAKIYVLPDYLSVGNNEDWARVPLTPMAAQRIADSFGCVLPTRKICDEIYKAAKVKLEPVPMFAFRDSTVTMYQHHLIIEGQRKGRKGLIAGIKKDVVVSAKINRENRPGRVAIYGWHLPGGKPIQPLYTGHVNWYVDYSHGIRLVYGKINVMGKWMDFENVLMHPKYRKLVCDEEYCDFYKYPY